MGNIKIFICTCLLAAVLAENQHNYYWREYMGTVPIDAFSFENLYVAQILTQGSSLLPGTLYAEKGEVITEWVGAKLVINKNIKVLCDQFQESFTWVYVNVSHLTNETLNDCVIGGFEDNSTLYIGKVFNEGEWKIGKVFPPTSRWKGLRVWKNNGRDYVTEDFQILKYKTQDAHIFTVR